MKFGLFKPIASNMSVDVANLYIAVLKEDCEAQVIEIEDNVFYISVCKTGDKKKHREHADFFVLGPQDE